MEVTSQFSQPTLGGLTADAISPSSFMAALRGHGLQ